MKFELPDTRDEISGASVSSIPMIFSREYFSIGLWNEMKPLLQKHYAETANKFYGPFNPDIEFYNKAQDMTRIFTMRQEDRLVGYQIYFILGDPHSLGRVQAVQDVLYLEPESRKGLIAYRFMKWCVDQLSGEVDVIFQRISARNDFGNLFRRMGFVLEDLTYAMEVS